MKANPKKLMVMSVAPNGRCVITQPNLTAAMVGDDVSIWRMCLDAVATEAIPQSEEAFSDFIKRHNAKPIYASLSAYPAPRG